VQCCSANWGQQGYTAEDAVIETTAEEWCATDGCARSDEKFPNVSWRCGAVRNSVLRNGRDDWKVFRRGLP